MSRVRKKSPDTSSYILYAVSVVMFVLVVGLVLSLVFKTNENGNNDNPVSAESDVKTNSVNSGTSFLDEIWLFFSGGLFDPLNILRNELPAISGVDVASVTAPVQEAALITPDEGHDIMIDENLPEIMRIEITKIKDDLSPVVYADDGPQILIYHTHTEEAYTKESEDEYIETDAWRTSDREHSIIKIGELLKHELESKYGFTVIHDETDHEPPKLSTSYDRSLVTMEKYKEKYPSLQIFIDLHRDSYDEMLDVHDIVTIEGKSAAKLMFVVGTGMGNTGDAFVERAGWRDNYKLALKITNELNSVADGFARPIRVKTGRYNQHVSPMALLIEVGHNGNTLQEAKNSLPALAAAISKSVEIKPSNS